MLLSITFVACIGIKRLRLDPANTGLFIGSDHDSRNYQTFLQTFGSDETILVALHDPQHSLLTAAGLGALQQLGQELAALPQVASVYSVLHAPDMARMQITPFGLAVPRLVPELSLSPSQIEGIASRAAVYGTLLSADLHTAAVFITPESTSRQAAQSTTWIAAVRTVAARYAIQGRQTYVAGTPIERHDVTHYLDRDQRLLTPLIVLILFLLTTWLYRGKRLAGVTLVCMLLPLLWTMGMAGWWGVQLNAMTSLLPAVIVLVSVSLSMHLINQMLYAIEGGSSEARAIDEAVKQVRVPSCFAALTTALGFFSLLTSPVPAIREFALFAGIGVLTSLLTTLFVMPLLLHSLRYKPLQRRIGRRNELLGRLPLRLTQWSIQHPRRLFGGVGMVVVLALPGIGFLTEGTDIIRALKAQAPLRVSSEFIDQHLTGVNSLELLVSLPAGAKETLPATIRQTLALSQWLREQAEVTAVFSPWELLRDAPAALLAQDAQLIVLGTLLPLAYPLDAWLASQSQTMRMSVRIRALNSEILLALVPRIKEQAARLGMSLEITGRTYLLARMSRVLVRSQLISLGLAILTIGTSMTVMLRSLRLGCIAMIPNILPSVIIFGLMGWCQIELSTATVMIASIALGLLVDDTIHLLYHYQEARQQGLPPQGALEQTVRLVGRAITATSLVLIGGFWGGLFGSFKPTIYFAFLTGLTLCFAWFVVLLVVPAVLMVWDCAPPAAAHS